ncbi:DUF2267 domain-containing protein [Dactylosporangium sp. NPDC000555]|uniref:DUF2267 domain-containing protein n=1 Tax=Dactylosporangium sp. NPDC000555 TaxID=3154260 RepID=UPI003329A90E
MAVGLEQLLEPVRESLGDDDTARRAVAATLRTIAERIGSDEARLLVPALPPEAAEWLFTTGPAQGFDPVEFVGRVASREGTPREVAERHASVVLTALGQTLDDEAYRHLTERLPHSYAPLLPRGEFAGGGATPDEWGATVAARAGLPPAEAERGTEVVLETLARKVGGDADDLTTFLPVRLHPALRRGRAAPAPDLGPAEFVVAVARHTGLSPQRAIRLIQAVMSALRDVVDDEAFLDVQAQLPGRYRELLRAP